MRIVVDVPLPAIDPPPGAVLANLGVPAHRAPQPVVTDALESALRTLRSVVRPRGLVQQIAADDFAAVYHGDCDTAIIKGVVALLVNLFSGRTVDKIRDLNVDRLFGELRLEEHLSPSRHFWVYAIVELMKKQAAALAGRSHKAA